LGTDRPFEARFLRFGEVGMFRATYPKPSSTAVPFIDVAGILLVNRSVGVGASYSRAAYSDVVGLAASIPHPVVFNAVASSTGLSEVELKRRDTAINIALVLVPVPTGPVQIRISGGPSILQYRADMVHDVLYTQTFDPASPQNAITIDGIASRAISGSGVGVHVGGDVTWFMNRHIGLGAGVRYTRAIARIDEEPLSKRSQDINVGGTLALVGIRVRFDR
jgi:hypothetical protein